VNEGSRQAKSRKACLARRRIKLRSVMPRYSEINGDLFVLGLRRAADMCVPQRAAMTRPNCQRPPDTISQGLQMIEEARRMPILTAAIPVAAFTGQLGDLKILPAPLICQGAARMCH